MTSQKLRVGYDDGPKFRLIIGLYAGMNPDTNAITIATPTGDRTIPCDTIRVIEEIA